MDYAHSAGPRLAHDLRSLGLEGLPLRNNGYNATSAPSERHCTVWEVGKTMIRLTTRDFSNPLGQAFWIMRVIFTVAPILFGLDKFFNILVDWPTYLAPWIQNLIHVSPQTFMRGVGVIEISVGILVGIWPHIFAYVVAVWLWGIIVNLLTVGEYFDVALRDFGLSMGALTLALWHMLTSSSCTVRSRSRPSPRMRLSNLVNARLSEPSKARVAGPPQP